MGGRIDRHTRIRELMTSVVVSIDQRASLADLERLLAANKVSGVPVLDGQELVGIVSKTDLTRHLAQEGAQRVERTRTPVWQIMTPNVIWAQGNETVENVARTMVHAGIHRVLVYEKDQPAGIVTSYDFVRFLAKGEPDPER